MSSTVATITCDKIDNVLHGGEEGLILTMIFYGDGDEEMTWKFRKARIFFERF